MFAITVRQPWAWAIIDGHKPVENRTQLGTWRRAAGQRVAVHAAAAWSTDGAASPLILDAFDRAHGIRVTGREPLPPYLFTPSALLGTVHVADVHEDAGCCRPWGGSRSTTPRGRAGRPAGSIVHLVLEEPRRLPDPLPYRGGQLGLWTVPDDCIPRLVFADDRPQS